MSEEQLEQLDGEMLLEEEFAKQRKEDIEKRRLEQADVAKNVKADEEYDRERQERLYEEQRRERREEVNRRIKLANYHMGSRGGSAESWASGGSLAVRIFSRLLNENPGSGIESHVIRLPVPGV